MGDLKNPRLIYLKGFLFLLIGLAASTLLLIEAPSLKVALLLVLAIWGFARAYYFAFYVIQHYVDDTYKFAGLWSFLRYLFRRWER
ncbi:MAG: hypothetical protein GXX96_15790 [Planctomycetaceae bacterium]|nr:hypothetical protein [Planctomycetaceae bacterium]